MSINPQTLYGLYNKGIIDYVPTDLLMPTPMGTMMPMTNPYLNLAQQGGLYQNHGYQSDSFTYNNYYNELMNDYNSYNQVSEGRTGIGSKSKMGGMAMYSGRGVGTKAHSIKNMFGLSGIGTKRRSSTNMFGEGGGVGVKSDMGGANMYGGMDDFRSEIVNSANNAQTIYKKTPNVIKGLIAGVIGVLAIGSLFKRGRKPKCCQGQTFLQKINPKNWFKRG